MVAQVDVDAEQFTTLHHGQLTAIQLQFSNYIKDLHQLKQSKLSLLPATDFGPAQSTYPASLVKPAPRVKPAISMDLTPDGFPILPNISFENLKKEELEDLMRTYLNKDYSKFYHISIK
jgi:hypothetical protein